MGRMNWRVSLATAVAVGVAVAGPLALAHGDASSKRPTYESDAKSHSGPVSPLPDVITFGGTEATSSTNNGGSSSDSTATPPTVLGIGPEASSCEASAGDGDNGVVRDEHSDAVLPLDLGVASVAILSTSCEARAVKSNNASGTARSSVVEASVSELDVAVLTTSSEAKTTSGNARSGSSFAVLEVGDQRLLDCSSSAMANNGTSSSSGDESLALLGIPLPVDCPGESTATHERTGPQG